MLILHSHVNAADLGSLQFAMELLARRTGCDVVAYDYSGYGGSEGTPSESESSVSWRHVYIYLYRLLHTIWEYFYLWNSSKIPIFIWPFTLELFFKCLRVVNLILVLLWCYPGFYVVYRSTVAFQTQIRTIQFTSSSDVYCRFIRRSNLILVLHYDSRYYLTERGHCDAVYYWSYASSLNERGRLWTEYRFRAHMVSG